LEIKSTVENSSKTSTGSDVLNIVTALASRIRSVACPIAPNTTDVAETAISNR